MSVSILYIKRWLKVLKEIFYDNLNNFQWSSIAAIASLLSLCTSGISVYINVKQSNKNRKSTTLVKLHIEQLEKVRDIAMKIDSKINSYINKKNNIGRGVKNIAKNDSIKTDLDNMLNELLAMLYQDTKHANEFRTICSLKQLWLMDLNNTATLTEINLTLKLALDKYTKCEHKKIEKSI